MSQLDELFEKYRPVTKEKLWENLKYFLEALMPTCHETGIKLAIHQDDPPWDIFGLPRLLVDKESIGHFLSMVDDDCNCLCLCSGSLGANPENNVPDIIRTYCDPIMFKLKKEYVEYENKSLRLPKDLIVQVQEMANKNNMSFNRVIIQCIEYALENADESEE